MTTIFVPQIAVVDFNHHRGPEIELWTNPAGEELYSSNAWTQLPFLALPDGAHASKEEFSYFTLVSTGSTQTGEAQTLDSTLFGLACTRQIRADRLKVKSAEVTRSFVQKAVVVIVDKPGALGPLRERLAAITAAWFAQEDFSDTEILKEFHSILEHEAKTRKNEKEAYFGLSLRELIYDLRYQTLILFKCLLLQKRVLFFGTRCERLCMTQFALVSLMPHLLENLQDCATPELNTYEQTVNRATNLKISERNSLLAYMGLPLQLFGKGSFFSPYTPLQQLDFLGSSSSKSYVAGSTNTLFLSQRDYPDAPNRYVDVLVNLDDPPSSRIAILEPSIRSALSLSAADRRWIDQLSQTVIDTWNPNDPSRPTNHGYQGSEEAIRLGFEEYILSLISSTAYKNHSDNHPNPYLSTTSGGVADERYPDPLETANDFNSEFLTLWRQTPNYNLWLSLTSDSSIFDIVEPRHPTAGGLNLNDVQRRVGAAVAELNLDEKVRQGREQAGKAIEVGREKVGLGVARFWKEVGSFKEAREQSRARSSVRNEHGTTDGQVMMDVNAEHKVVFDASRRSDESTTAATRSSLEKPAIAPISTSTAGPANTLSQSTTTPTNTSTTPTTATGGGSGGWTSWRNRTPEVHRPHVNVNVDTSQVQSAAKENAARAGAYLSSWGSWARDKSREWQESRSQNASPAPSATREGRRASTGLGTGVTGVGSRSGSVSGSGNAGAAAALSKDKENEPVVEVLRQVSAGAVSAARSAMSPIAKTETK